jgi:hypothetical protein
MHRARLFAVDAANMLGSCCSDKICLADSTVKRIGGVVWCSAGLQDVLTAEREKCLVAHQGTA